MKKGIIRIDPIEQDLYIYIGKCKNYLDIIHKDFEPIADISHEWDGFHAFLPLKSKVLAHVIYIEKVDYGLIFHELIHCANAVMSTSGIDNEEFMAYLCQHLFYEIIKLIRSK